MIHKIVKSVMPHSDTLMMIQHVTNIVNNVVTGWMALCVHTIGHYHEQYISYSSLKIAPPSFEVGERNAVLKIIIPTSITYGLLNNK